MIDNSENESIKDFVGTKIALINNGKVLACLRDNKPGIHFPGMWDFPGGAREEGETPFETVSREIKEELGITITQDEVVWEKVYPAVAYPDKKAVFMVINISDDQLKSVIFGDEGQEWKMMAFDEFINHKNAVPGMQTRLRDYLNETKENIPVFTIHLPKYKVDAEPDHEKIGKVVDDEIKKHFMGQTILIRALGSMEHPDKTIDEMIEIIKTSGTDRYDTERAGDRYANIQGKYINLYALRRTISPKTKLFWQLSWSFYRSPLKVRGYPVRVDIITIYDPKQLKAVVHQPENHPYVKRDGFIFKNPANKPAAVKAIFKITG